jgi:ABC transport system ATP-binding/permease protein
MNISYWLMLFTTSCFANMLGLNISSGFNSVVTIYILIPLLLVPQLLLSGVIVKFDKLHKWIASYEYVSPFGDMMASRWAYEGIAVNQFKNNEYEKNFYKIEKEMSFAVYRYNLLIPELKSKIFECQKNFAAGENKEQATKRLLITKNEVIRLRDEVKTVPFDCIDSLVPERLTVDVAQKTSDFLDEVKKVYVDQYNAASAKKDEKFNKLVKKMGSKEAVDKLKQDYHNEKVEDAVKNKEELQKFVEGDDHMIQLFEPVFKEPIHNYGRAQFYAPVKKFFGKSIDTYWFNMAVIWLMSLFFYFTLSFDALKKFLDFTGNIRFFKSKKKAKT